MKKFFKALAVVLALTLVIGTIPASAADSDLSLKKASKILYIGGAKGTKADGTACKTGSACLLSKLVKNFNKDTMTIKVESADKAIAKTTSKSSKVSAVGIGSTTVTVSVFDSDDIKIFEKDIKVTVKKNAEAVAVNSDALASGKVGVNTPYTVVLPRKADGKFVDTDGRNLTANDDSVVIKKVAATTFEVTFTKAGDFELTAYAYQSSKFTAATATAEVIKVNAALNPIATKQASLSSAYVEFDCNVEGIVGADNFRAYTKTIDGKPVFFSNVEKVTAEGEKAEIKFFTAFLADHEYFLSYNGVEVGSFKAITVTKDSVVDVEVKDITIFCDEVTAADAAYKLLDASGIDIKDAMVDGAKLSSKATFKFTDADGSQAFVDGDKLYIKEAGKTYTCEINYKDTFKKTFKVTSVAKETWGFVGFDYDYSGVYSKDAANVVVDKKIAGNAAKKVTLTMSEVGSYNEVLQVVANYQKGADVEKRGLDVTGFKAVSGDEKIVMVGNNPKDADGNDIEYSFILSPNNEGTANIIIYEVLWDGTEKAIGYIPVEVKPARKATTPDVKLGSQMFNVGYAADSIKVEYSLKDQYGDDFKFDSVSFEQKNNTDVVTASVTGGALTFTLVNADKLPKDKDKSVDVTLEFTFAPSNLKKSVSVKVGNETFATSYKLNLSEKEIDTALTAETTSVKSVVVSTLGATKNGYNFAGKDVDYADAAPVSKMRETTNSATTYVYTVSLNGATIKDADNANIDGSIDTIKGVVAGAKATKLAAGTYTVTLYQVDDTFDDQGKPVTLAKAIDSASFKVVDNQKGLEITKVKEYVDGIDNLKDAFTIKFNGADVKAATVLKRNVNEGTKRAYVDTASYTFTSAFGDVTITANVDVLVDLAKLVDLK